jgi:hypothetical protein
MTKWTEDDHHVYTARIDGHDYRIHKQGHFRGEDIWVGEINENKYWHRIGSSYNNVQSAKTHIENEIKDLAIHSKEKSALNRQEISYNEKGPWTTWGRAQSGTRYAVGVTFYETASHGGFKLSAGRLAKMPLYLQNEDGNYEEDSEWSMVGTAFPELFTTRERRQAENILRNTYPDEWEAHYKCELKEGESRSKDARIFLERHRNDLIVVSALNAGDGMVSVWAVPGGDRTLLQAEARHFLVPSDEYETRHPAGFVIDQSRHEEITLDGPQFR